MGDRQIFVDDSEVMIEEMKDLTMAIKTHFNDVLYVDREMMEAVTVQVAAAFAAHKYDPNLAFEFDKTGRIGARAEDLAAFVAVQLDRYRSILTWAILKSYGVDLDSITSVDDDGVISHVIDAEDAFMIHSEKEEEGDSSS